MGIILTALLLAASFEVASVKPEPWTGQGGVGVTTHGNTLTAEHSDLYGLVTFAYNLKDFQLSGGPAWAKHGILDQSELFQVVAKAGGNVAPSEEEFRAMLQALLAERFQLKVRHVVKEFPVYRLVVGKNGAKVRESSADTKFLMTIKSGSGDKPTQMVVRHAALSRLVSQIEMQARRPVVDETGLAGLYDFELDWEGDGLADAVGQLGLRLVAGTAPLDSVVIESAERPSGN
jgi:uncharacterized protein (TIGR03435 family)